jgi:ABC-type Mn2+/Zn2+ transport system ATPase subunit
LPDEISAPESDDRIDITLTPINSSKYKSLGTITWNGVPPFAILTGLNGSGKSQLLEAISFPLMKANNPQTGQPLNVDVKVSGDTFDPDDIVYIPAAGLFANSTAVGISDLQQIKQNLFEQLRTDNVQSNRQMQVRRQKLQKKMNVANLDSISPQEFIKLLPDDFVFMLDENDVVTGLAFVFIAHRLKIVRLLECGSTLDAANTELGPAPWDVVNETLGTAGFPYNVLSPLGTDLYQPYNLVFHDVTTKEPRNPGDLSSGEKVILQLVLWLYNSENHSRFPRLMILDEPDAHLHPSMAYQFINVINDVLVAKHKVRVIMSTHSPSTVALAPEGSLFEMSKSDPRIRPSVSKSHAIGLLTAGLVTVSEATRFVLVEDIDDVNFYSCVHGILTDFGPSKDPQSLEPTPSIVFLPASRGENIEKISGGKSVVKAWVEKFDLPPLSELVRGIIDLDFGNDASDRLFVVGRHSIENYLIDPILIFALLTKTDRCPVINGIQVSEGDEHMIRGMTSKQLNKIVDAIAAIVEPSLGNLLTEESGYVEVKLTRGQIVKYRKWMINRRGKDLMVKYQECFGGPMAITPPKLIEVLKRVRLIPTELANVFRSVQAQV